MKLLANNRQFCLALIAIAFCSCQTLPAAKSKGVTHVAVFWLKRPGNSADRQTLISAAQELKSIPGVQTITIGPPLGSHRPEVDSHCDLVMVAQFPNEQALRQYEKNPIHLAAVKRVLVPLVRKLVVYDFADR